MDRAMDLAQRLPMQVLLIGLALSVVVPLGIGALVGGWPAAIGAFVGVVGLVTLGSALALKVHINRLPMRLSTAAARARLDGHPSFHFRAQLGRGRRMDTAKGRVRFLPDMGDAVELEPLLAGGESLYGPWTLVVVDRDEQIRGPGRFEVHVEAVERGKHWQADSTYPLGDLVDGRFTAAVGPTRLIPMGQPTPAFDRIEPSAPEA